jgi:hypothetical protein
VATYIAVQWDMKTAFERFSTLFDQLFGEGSEGVFEETIRSTRDDPNGPGIDIRVDLIGHLGERAAIITDYKLPIDPTSERMVFVAETTDERALADAVRRSLENDPEVVKIEHGQFVIWEMRPIQEDVPEIVVDNAGEDLGVEEEMEEEVKIPNSAVAVAKGNLFISSHVDFLKRILDETPEADQLSSDVDYKLVMEKLDSLGAGEAAVRTFARGDERIRPTYELFKAGKLPESDTLIASIANAILGGDEEEGVIRKPALDGSKLPDFQIVRRYLTCGGSYVSTQDQGWLIVGMSLGKIGEE